MVLAGVMVLGIMLCGRAYADAEVPVNPPVPDIGMSVGQYRVVYFQSDPLYVSQIPYGDNTFYVRFSIASGNCDICDLTDAALWVYYYSGYYVYVLVGGLEMKGVSGGVDALDVEFGTLNYYYPVLHPFDSGRFGVGVIDGHFADNADGAEIGYVDCAQPGYVNEKLLFKVKLIDPMTVQNSVSVAMTHHYADGSFGSLLHSANRIPGTYIFETGPFIFADPDAEDEAWAEVGGFADILTGTCDDALSFSYDPGWGYDTVYQQVRPKLPYVVVEIETRVRVRSTSGEYGDSQDRTDPVDYSKYDKQAKKQTEIGKLAAVPAQQLQLSAWTDPFGQEIEGWDIQKVYTDGTSANIKADGTIIKIGGNWIEFTPPDSSWVTPPNTISDSGKEFRYRFTAKSKVNNVYFDIWIFDKKDVKAEVYIITGGGALSPGDFADKTETFTVEIEGKKEDNVAADDAIAKYVDYLAKIYRQVGIEVKFDKTKNIHRFNVDPNDAVFGGQFNNFFHMGYFLPVAEVTIGGDDKLAGELLLDYTKTKFTVDEDAYNMFFVNNIGFLENGNLQIVNGMGLYIGGNQPLHLAWISDSLTPTSMAHEGGHALGGLDHASRKTNVMKVDTSGRGTKIQDTLEDAQFQNMRKKGVK